MPKIAVFLTCLIRCTERSLNSLLPLVKSPCMKDLRLLLVCGLLLACEPAENEVVSEFTGNETTYSLQSGSAHNVNGTIVFKERRDGQITATVQLSGTNGSQKHPVHLHLGNLSTPDADIALLLMPVEASTGTSTTKFSMLADESTITYAQLIEMEAAVKIHLGDVGPDRDVILSAGDIGLSFTKANPNGRTGIANCKSD